MIQMPERIARLERDSRGYPIPFNVLRADDGTPFFTINDDRIYWRCMREQLCPICGDKLGKWKWFVGGPRSAFDPHGWYFDLPGHHECEQYALAVCPYLAMPKYLNRVDVVHAEKLPDVARILLDETQITDRPEIFVTVVGSGVEIKESGGPAPYIRPKRPFLAYEFWRHGKEIPTVEAMPYLRQALGESFQLPEVETE